jgi:hypothetical protein
MAESDAQRTSAPQNKDKSETENDKQKQRIRDLTQDIERIDKQYQREISRAETLFATQTTKEAPLSGPKLMGAPFAARSRALKWVLGIVAAVISAALVYHFSAPSASPPVITFEGLVIDGEQNTAIGTALVSLELQDRSGQSYHAFTDDHGSYKILLSGLSKSARATLRVQAKGYRESSRTIPSLAGENRNDWVLTPLPDASPKTQSRPTPTPSQSRWLHSFRDLLTPSPPPAAA